MRERIERSKQATDRFRDSKTRLSNADFLRGIGEPSTEEPPSRKEVAGHESDHHQARQEVERGAKNSESTIAQHHPYEGHPKDWHALGEHIHATARLYGADPHDYDVTTRPGQHGHERAIGRGESWSISYKTAKSPGRVLTQSFTTRKEAERFAKEAHPHISDHFHPGTVREASTALVDNPAPKRYRVDFRSKKISREDYDYIRERKT
jgi:hypothetical protein